MTLEEYSDVACLAGLRAPAHRQGMVSVLGPGSGAPRRHDRHRLPALRATARLRRHAQGRAQPGVRRVPGALSGVGMVPSPSRHPTRVPRSVSSCPGGRPSGGSTHQTLELGAMTATAMPAVSESAPSGLPGSLPGCCSHPSDLRPAHLLTRRRCRERAAEARHHSPATRLPTRLRQTRPHAAHRGDPDLTRPYSPTKRDRSVKSRPLFVPE